MAYWSRFEASRGRVYLGVLLTAELFNIDESTRRAKSPPHQIYIPKHALDRDDLDGLDGLSLERLHGLSSRT